MPEYGTAPVRAPQQGLDASAYAALPNWSELDLSAGVEALRRSCSVFAARPSNQPISLSARWAGTPRDWQSVCLAVQSDLRGDRARSTLEALMTPLEVVDPAGESRFTGYFEPTYEARRRPSGPFTEPVPAVPDDLIEQGGRVQQKLSDGRFRPYPTRAEITSSGVTPIAYARAADVFFLQIQGSGRLLFPDGSTIRAAYGANNGHQFASTANWLMNRGWISRSEASMTGIAAWMERAPPHQMREAMNANPRFVFFIEKPEGDPSLGPDGALGVPLTPFGSIAIDPSLHPLGVPMFVQTTAPGLGGDWSGLLIAQDTGNAIRGVVRGDVYFGTGRAAGAAAETLNAPGRMWILLPRPLARRIMLGNTQVQFR
ncbi:MAG: MltA domain-containing protein, partial [Pseudomonadota bacterium]